MKKILLLLTLILAACAPQSLQAPLATQQAGVSDDFSSFNTSLWKSGYPWGSTDNGNMGNTNAANISTGMDADGTKYLRLKSPAANNIGAITSREQFGYGTFTARLRFTSANGQWPAFWQLNDPAGLEFDTIELLGNNPTLYYMTTHFNGRQVGQGVYSNPGSLANQWHVYSSVWTPAGVTFYFDGSPKYSYPYTGTMYAQNVIFDMGIMCLGIIWNNNKCDSTTFITTPEMDIDYFTYVPSLAPPSTSTPFTSTLTSTPSAVPSSTATPTRTFIPATSTPSETPTKTVTPTYTPSTTPTKTATGLPNLTCIDIPLTLEINSTPQSKLCFAP